MESELIEHFIKKKIAQFLPHHQISEIYDWALFPAGKLFRPKLAYAIYSDLTKNDSLKNLDSLLYFASALECHHAYSLVHDDLPSMDNDEFRRGKLSVHKKFGEWKAILVGDGLLNISYQFISKTNLKNHSSFLLSLFSHSLGPKGLIHGQVLDLSLEMRESFQKTILTHQLKTARLIQISLVGAAIISFDQQNLNIKNKSNDLKNMWRLGENLGILFQLLDDLSELSENELSLHEIDVNPWLKNATETMVETKNRLIKLQKILNEQNFTTLNKILHEYFQKMNNHFKKYQNATHLKSIDLIPLMTLIDNI
jgi:geranylgeranyl pyrophosphate synthase